MTIRELRKAVEAGALPEPVFHGSSVIRGHWAYTTGLDAEQRRWVFLAYNGSLDAAKRLHDALLPGWDWTMHGNGQAALWPPGSVDQQNAGVIEVDVDGWPSRALLLCILRALEQEGGMGEAPDKWICTDCRIVVDKPLSAKNPFDPADTIFGCPSCKSIGTLVQACQHEGCQKEAGGGYPDTLGYRYAWLCWEHSPRGPR